MLEQLRKRREDAERRCDEACAAIPAAILDGDEDRLAELRRERMDAAIEADDVADAVEVAAARERRALKEAEAGRRRVERDGARKLAGARTEAAAAVDDALAALDVAVAEHRDLGLELSRSLRAAGCRDDRIARMASQDLRWAAWMNAPTAAEIMQVPRAPVHRRRNLADMQAAAVPAMPEEDG